MELKVGMKHKYQELVTPEKLAVAYGSGGLEVYATPGMIALMESACLKCVEDAVGEGNTTVGTKVCVEHLALTPVFMMAAAECELIEIDGRRLVFKVMAFDECGKIGEGTHERFIVNAEKFKEKCAYKSTL